MTSRELGLRKSYTEYITWPRRDTKFLFERWKIFHEWAQRTSEIFFSTREMKFRISKRPCNVLFIIINTNEIPNHVNLIVFWCERHDLLCSHGKGDIFTCEDNNCYFHMWRYQVFARKLTWYFIGVYIIKLIIPIEQSGRLIIPWPCQFNRRMHKYFSLVNALVPYLKCFKTELTSMFNIEKYS